MFIFGLKSGLSNGFCSGAVRHCFHHITSVKILAYLGTNFYSQSKLRSALLVCTNLLNPIDEIKIVVL